MVGFDLKNDNNRLQNNIIEDLDHLLIVGKIFRYILRFQQDSIFEKIFECVSEDFPNTYIIKSYYILLYFLIIIIFLCFKGLWDFFSLIVGFCFIKYEQII